MKESNDSVKALMEEIKRTEAMLADCREQQAAAEQSHGVYRQNLESALNVSRLWILFSFSLFRTRSRDEPLRSAGSGGAIPMDDARRQLEESNKRLMAEVQV